MYLSHERGRKGSHHRFITEKRVFKNWARTFNIHFFQPDWKPESLAINHPENKPVFWGMSVSDQNPKSPLYQTPGHWTSWAPDMKEEQNWQEIASLLKKYHVQMPTRSDYKTVPLAYRKMPELMHSDACSPFQRSRPLISMMLPWLHLDLFKYCLQNWNMSSSTAFISCIPL